MSNLNTDEIREDAIYWRKYKVVKACRAFDSALMNALAEIDRLKEELEMALSIANRSSKAVLKWNDEIEQRTKEECKEATAFEKFAEWWLKEEGFSIHESQEPILVAVWKWKEQAIEEAGKT